jgi:hypothetical protein
MKTAIIALLFFAAPVFADTTGCPQCQVPVPQPQPGAPTGPGAPCGPAGSGAPGGPCH